MTRGGTKRASDRRRKGKVSIFVDKSRGVLLPPPPPPLCLLKSLSDWLLMTAQTH